MEDREFKKTEKDEKHQIHEGHRKRMKERLFKDGCSSFADHELIEMLLYSTYPRQNTNEKAHKILNEYDNNLGLLFDADPTDIMNRCNVSENTAMFFSIASELLHRYLRVRFSKKKVIDSSELAGEYAVFLLSREKRECFYVICLDVQSRLIGTSLVSKGSISETAVYLRNIMEAAFKFNARSIIIAHNHPGGSLVPTSDDISTTVQIIKIMNQIDIYVVDHIIVADDKYISLCDEGFIKNMI
ncbi:MAG: DNA repair protein RadC [Clostridia bacterium]|jgi:DNA repair protein RadC|nr:DNA repair protein RadC [Clostridia bacterium]